MSKKLVMTLLTRNEDDILENNICFHLAHGVDFIVATDNGSTDKTPEILEKYVKRGVLWYRTIREFNNEQAKWVSEMAKIAVKRFGATHLFHCDADEFWYPRRGNLKTFLPIGNEIFYVSVANYFPGNEYIVANPVDQINSRNSTGSANYLLYRYPPKVITTPKFTRVIQGNHDVRTQKPTIKMNVNHIVIHHFPIRSYEQFKKKVIQTGAAYRIKKRKTKAMGWHSRAWYKLYEAGRLKKEYRKLCLENRIHDLLATDTLRRVRPPYSIRFAKKIYTFKYVLSDFCSFLWRPIGLPLFSLGSRGKIVLE